MRTAAEIAGLNCVRVETFRQRDRAVAVFPGLVPDTQHQPVATLPHEAPLMLEHLAKPEEYD